MTKCPQGFLPRSRSWLLLATQGATRPQPLTFSPNLACFPPPPMEGSEQNQASQELPERSLSLTIDGLPDELLLEIFDSYRLNQDGNERWNWNRNLRWCTLTHVCRRWRRVVFASLFRLDVALTVSNFNPGHMRALFSPHLPPLPIDVDYWPGLLALPTSVAYVPHSDFAIASAGSIFEDHVSTLIKFSRSLNVLFPHWRSSTFTTFRNMKSHFPRHS
ncbi:hypothetical protein BC826DRAFT_658909 [Russula brevipes]|nr:hypothetical protein BC826DRAFT_658909 [Russula brevipes]